MKRPPIVDGLFSLALEVLFKERDLEFYAAVLRPARTGFIVFNRHGLAMAVLLQTRAGRALVR